MNKKNLPEELVKGLKGFEDVFDDYLKNEEKRKIERWEQEREKKGDQYELANFLEIEEKRIEAVETFLTKKVSQQLNFSQADKIANIQLERKKQLLLKIIPEIMSDESNLKKNLSAMYNAHFT